MDLCHKQGIAIYSPYQSDVAPDYISPWTDLEIAAQIIITFLSLLVFLLDHFYLSVYQHNKSRIHRSITYCFLDRLMYSVIA